MRAQYPMPGRCTPWRPFWGPVRGHRCWRGRPSRDYGPRMVKRAVPKPNLQPRCRLRPLELPKMEPLWRYAPVSNAGNVMARGSSRTPTQVILPAEFRNPFRNSKVANTRPTSGQHPANIPYIPYKFLYVFSKKTGQGPNIAHITTMLQYGHKIS